MKSTNDVLTYREHETIHKRYPLGSMVWLSVSSPDFCIERTPPYLTRKVTNNPCGLTSINRRSVRVKEEFEDTKGVVRIRKLKKDRQHNGQIKMNKRIYYNQKVLPGLMALLVEHSLLVEVEVEHILWFVVEHILWFVVEHILWFVVEHILLWLVEHILSLDKNKVSE